MVSQRARDGDEAVDAAKDDSPSQGLDAVNLQLVACFMVFCASVCCAVYRNNCPRIAN
eukprot:XP_001708701.1 Hypothetical protein GL50803_34823 [Giardia lamblia ATCC 50803]